MKILVLGGNRFFGKRLVGKLIHAGHDVTILNRGSVDDGFSSTVTRIKCDRSDATALGKVVGDTDWDIVYDQICYDAVDAAAAIEIFSGKVKNYIFTSSQSVYLPGQNITEDEFDPRSYYFSQNISTKQDYAEAKRQCEQVFFHQDKIPITAVRFPIVIGPDDYTNRLKFHIEHAVNGKEVFFPNIAARISFVFSEDAATALKFLGEREAVGPINVCSRESIRLSEVINKVELVTGKSLPLIKNEKGGDKSPYGIPTDWFMNTDKLQAMGFEAQPILSWLPKVIQEIFHKK